MSQVSATTLDPMDILGIDDELGKAERDLRDAVRSYGKAELAPQIAKWFETGTLPSSTAMSLGPLGLLGMHLKGYGCAGASAMAYGVACRELEAVDSGVRSFVSTQGSLAMFAIHRWGSEEHKRRWLPSMATGESIGCFALTEAEAGSDPSAMHTQVRRDGDYWVLDGSKMWITNGAVADVAVVWAQIDPRQGSKGIRGFVVPTDTPGFSAIEVKQKLSLRASVTGQLTLNSVRLPADAMLPESQGLGAAMTCLNEGRYGIV